MARSGTCTFFFCLTVFDMYWIDTVVFFDTLLNNPTKLVQFNLALCNKLKFDGFWLIYVTQQDIG